MRHFDDGVENKSQTLSKNAFKRSRPRGAPEFTELLIT
jgi:hypothetical protein